MPKANAQPDSQRGSSGEATRRRLMDASTQLVVERGWGAVTTRAVADRAGVNQALVHYHFGSIEDLRRESVIDRLLPAIGALAQELLDERPLPESMHRVMRRIDDFDLGTETGVLMAEALLQATRDPAVAAAMGGVMGSWSEMLAPRIALAQERGVVRPDIPAQRLAPMIASFLDGYLIQRMADPGFEPAAAADTLNALLANPPEDRS